MTLIERSFYLTLVLKNNAPPPSQHVWGAAYHIPTQHVAEVQAYLDIREINGYSVQYTPFQPADPSILPIENCMVYIGLPSNPQFLGPQDRDELARHIRKSEGPSGGNPEYLFMLEEALMGLGNGAGDEHVEDIARRVRSLKKHTGEGPAEDDLAGDAKHNEVKRLESGISGHEQEEIEQS